MSAGKSVIYYLLLITAFSGYLNTDAYAQKVALTSKEQAWLAEHPDIRLGFNPHMEPLLIKNKDGSYDGIYPSIINELEKVLGINVNIEVDDWNPVVQKARLRQVDGLLACAPSQAKASNLLRTNPFHNAYPVVFVRQDAHFSVNSLADLKNKSIAYQREVKMLEVVLNQFENSNQILAVNSTLEAMKLVLEGKVDVAFGVNFENYLVAKHSLSGIKLSYLDLEHANPISTCIRSDWPELVDIFNKGLSQIGQEKVQKILTEWTNISEEDSTMNLTSEEKAWLAEDHHVQVRITNFPPYIITNPDGDPEGIAVDYLKLIAERTGVKFDYHVSGKTFSEALEGLKKHQGPDVISTIMATPERQNTILFTKDFLKSPYVIFNRSDDKRIVTSMLDLAGKKIASVKGTVLQEKILKDYPDSNLLYFKNDVAAIEAVSNKKADAYIGNLTLASYHILSKGLYNIKLAAPSPFGDHVFSMGVRNDWPQLVHIIDKGLASITPEEQMLIRKKYFSVQYDQSNNAEILKWGLIAAGIGASIIILFIVWNRSLKKQVDSRTKSLKIEISERKQVEEALRGSEAQLSNALKIADAGHWEYDVASDTFLFNDNFYRIFRTTAEKEGGYKMSSAEYASKFCHPEDMSLVQTETLAAIESNDPNYSRQLEHRIIYADGEIGYIAVRFNVIKDSKGNTVKTYGVNQDITERKRIEEERKKLEAQVRQSYKMEAIGTLAGGIAHDFNNILGSIMGYAEMAKEDTTPGSQIEKDLEKVLIGATRAKELVKQILAFSRQAEVERIPLKIAPLIKEGLKMLRSSIPTTIKIVEDIATETESILADPTQIHQILMNLCTNAYHSMEETGGTLSVALKNTVVSANAPQFMKISPGEYVELAVKDTGVGIGPDVIERVFDPYYTTKEVGKGTGMGLAIIHGIIKEYGGTITVESELGKGATFHVYFPVINREAIVETKEPESVPGGKERVLFIDDEELLAEMGKDLLERLGYAVTVRRNSLEALTTFQNSPDEFDIVITDQTMPEMTGIDLARRMLQIRPDIPIILCTGYSNLVDDASVKALGIKEFALKPLTKAAIAELIRKVLDERITTV